MSTDSPTLYRAAEHPLVPTPFTKALRTSLIWQFIRFWVISLKIVKLLSK